MRKNPIKSACLVVGSALILSLTACGNNPNGAPASVGAKKQVKSYSQSCQKMHGDLEKMYGQGKGGSKLYAKMLNTYMNSCL